MPDVYLVINQGGNHESVRGDGGGASEYLFYLVAEHLSRSFNVVVFNRAHPCKIDGVEHRNQWKDGVPDLPPRGSDDGSDAIVIVQRAFELVVDTQKAHPRYKYVLWSHDHFGCSEQRFGPYTRDEIDSHLSQHRIHVVSVSKYHQRNLLSILPNATVSPIYNGLFPGDFAKDANVAHNRNKLIFCSAWHKGLDRVLAIGSAYSKVNNQFELVLVTPRYCEWDPDLSAYPFVTKLGNIANKKEYSRLIQSCLAVFSTSFPETFGCAFAEALHLGVPVIGDSSVDAGFHEIIPREHMRDFRNPAGVIDLIESFRRHRPEVRLDKKFYSESVMECWRELLEGI